MTSKTSKRILHRAKVLADWFKTELPKNNLALDLENSLHNLLNQLDTAIKLNNEKTLTELISQLDHMIEHHANNDLTILQNSLPQTHP